MARKVTTEQCYTLVNALYEQATGQKAIEAVDLNTFMAVASGVKALTTNQIYKGLTEVLNGITFSVRPYTGFFRLPWRTESEYGARRYKVSYLDNAKAEESPAWKIKDGDMIGVHTVKIPDVYEADIWGDNVLMAHITITEEQIRSAFNGPDELGRFFSGLMQNIEDQMEQQREGMCRTAVLNLAAGVYSFHASEDPNIGADMQKSTIHLLSEFNARFSPKAAKTLPDILSNPALYTQFAKYIFHRMERVAKEFANRDKYYHVNPKTDPQCVGTDGIIMRHTPARDLRCMICDELLSEIDTQVLTDIRNLEYMKLVPHESVNYWQDCRDKMKIVVNPKVMGANGETAAAGEQTINNLFAVMYDRDALGLAEISTDVGDTPYDVEKHAFNRYWTKRVKVWTDFTEKAAVFVLD